MWDLTNGENLEVGYPGEPLHHTILLRDGRVVVCGTSGLWTWLPRSDGTVDRLKAMGLISEIIAWKLRLFVPTSANGPEILGALMDRYPIVRIADRTAA